MRQAAGQTLRCHYAGFDFRYSTEEHLQLFRIPSCHRGRPSNQPLSQTYSVNEGFQFPIMPARDQNLIGDAGALDGFVRDRDRTTCSKHAALATFQSFQPLTAWLNNYPGVGPS